MKLLGKNNKWLLACCWICLAIGSGRAQVYNVLDIVKADRDKASGCEGPYQFIDSKMTPAPKGYKPFYVSHYARHGSRYAWNPRTYVLLKEVLEEAGQKGVLTERGERFKKDFMEFYLEPYVNTGDLTALGWKQHERIGQQVGKWFPEVFKYRKQVRTMASTSQRAIVSMGAFCVGLAKEVPSLEIEGNSLHTNMVFVNSGSAPKEYAHHYSERLHHPEHIKSADFNHIKLNYDELLGILFKDRAFLGDRTDEFLSELYMLWAGYRNYCNKGFMEDLFTPDQWTKLWEASNYGCYAGHVLNRAEQKNLLDNIIKWGDEAIDGSGIAMDARFGHDVVLNAFYSLLNINGSAHICEKADDVKYWFQSYHTPKASTFLMVFYKSKKKGDDILFKVMRNGLEVTLPQLEAVKGCYYKWNDLKRWRQTI